MAQPRKEYKEYYFADDEVLQQYKKYWETPLSVWVKRFMDEPESRELIAEHILLRRRHKMSEAESRDWDTLIAKLNQEHRLTLAEKCLVGMDALFKIKQLNHATPSYFNRQLSYKNAEKTFNEIDALLNESKEINTSDIRSITWSSQAILANLAGNTRRYRELIQKRIKGWSFVGLYLDLLNTVSLKLLKSAAMEGSTVVQNELFKRVIQGSTAVQNELFRRVIHSSSYSETMQALAVAAAKNGSGWALIYLGRQYYHSVDYEKAGIYKRFGCLDPIVHEGMQITDLETIHCAPSDFLAYQKMVAWGSAKKFPDLIASSSGQFFDAMLRSGDEYLLPQINEKTKTKIDFLMLGIIGYSREIFSFDIVKLIFGYVMPEIVFVPLIEKLEKEDKQIVDDERLKLLNEQNIREKEQLKIDWAEKENYRREFLMFRLPPDEVRELDRKNLTKKHEYSSR